MPATGDGSNYVSWFTGNSGGGDWRLGTGVNSTDGGTTWSDNSTARSQRLYGYLQRTSDRVYRADPSHIDRWKPIGWKADNTSVVSGNTDTVVMGGKMTTLAGLTIGADYYLPIEMDVSANGDMPSTPLEYTDDGEYWQDFYRSYAGNIDWYRHIPWLGGATLRLGRAISATDLLTPEPATGYEMVPFVRIDDYGQTQTSGSDSEIVVPHLAKAAIIDAQYLSGTEHNHERLTIYKWERKTHSVRDKDGSDQGVDITWDPDTNIITISSSSTGVTREYTIVTFLG